MKKFISVTLSVLLIVSLCFAFTGCHKDSEIKIVGTWKGTETCDLSNAKDLLGEEAASMAAVFDYMDLGTYELEVTYTFNADGTFSMVADVDVAEAVLEDILTKMMDGFEAYFEDFAQSASMTADQLAQASGYANFEAFMDEIAALANEQVKETIKSKQEGTYTLVDDKLVIANTTTDEISEGKITELTDTVLKIEVKEQATVLELTKSK